MTFREIYKSLRDLLRSASESAGTEALLLLSHVTGMTKERILLCFEDQIDDISSERILELARLRLSGFPLQYITKKCYFYGLELDIEDGVFIPRVETEVLVDLALDLIEREDLKTVLDVGTGSGAIAIAIALNSHCKVYGTDIHEKAIYIAQRNAKKYNAEITFLKGPFLEPVKGFLKEIDLVVSNPPYVSTSANLSKEVLKEPSNALFAGKEGIDFYRKFFADRSLLKGKDVIMEFSPEQVDHLREICFFGKISFFHDQFGKIRFFHVKV